MPDEPAHSNDAPAGAPIAVTDEARISRTADGQTHRNTLVVAATAQIRIDISPQESKLEDRFRLTSGEEGDLYDVTLSRSQSVPLDEDTIVVQFGRLDTSLRYTLYHLPDPAKEEGVMVFRDVAFEDLEKLDPEASDGEQEEVDPESTPLDEPPKWESGDPDLRPDPGDANDERNWIGPPNDDSYGKDPHDEPGSEISNYG